MIITRDEVKALLKITDTTNDVYIDMLIPLVEASIVKTCNDHFISNSFDYIGSSAITFINSDNSINLTNLHNMKLVANDSIRIYKSFRNNQTFTVSSVASNKIVVDDIDTIKDEDENEHCYISKLDYPVELKFVASSMVQYKLDNYNNAGNIKAEKIDDYSIQYAVDSKELVNGFPSSIMDACNEFKLPYTSTLFTKGLIY